MQAGALDGVRVDVRVCSCGRVCVWEYRRPMALRFAGALSIGGRTNSGKRAVFGNLRVIHNESFRVNIGHRVASVPHGERPKDRSVARSASVSSGGVYDPARLPCPPPTHPCHRAPAFHPTSFDTERVRLISGAVCPRAAPTHEGQSVTLGALSSGSARRQRGTSRC
eukprot:ctg_1003.g414